MAAVEGHGDAGGVLRAAGGHVRLARGSAGRRSLLLRVPECWVGSSGSGGGGGGCAGGRVGAGFSSAG